MSSTSLPADWVDTLFARLAVRYGRAWLAMWEGIDIALVKADWAQELGCFADTPSRITVGLEKLPERPPNASQFRALCAGVQGDAYRPAPRLPAAKADPEVAAAAVAKLRALSARLRMRQADEGEAS